MAEVAWEVDLSPRTIPNKPTWYAGKRFRSKTEARWAVFFDQMGYEWQYEPKMFDGLYYLPDFYLPEMKTWVEVKGRGYLTATEWYKAFALMNRTKEDFLALVRSPDLHPFDLVSYHWLDKGLSWAAHPIYPEWLGNKGWFDTRLAGDDYGIMFEEAIKDAARCEFDA